MPRRLSLERSDMREKTNDSINKRTSSREDNPFTNIMSYSASKENEILKTKFLPFYLNSSLVDYSNISLGLKNPDNLKF